eukprot:3368200-Prymnesium_polylepis.1
MDVTAFMTSLVTSSISREASMMITEESGEEKQSHSSYESLIVLMYSSEILDSEDLDLLDTLANAMCGGTLRYILK